VQPEHLSDGSPIAYAALTMPWPMFSLRRHLRSSSLAEQQKTASLVPFVAMSDPSGTPVGADRYANERNFHDQRFTDAPRRSDAFYAVNGACDDHYQAALSSILPGERVLEYGCG